jgi:uncharacterized protein (TIGR03084 family)
VRQPQRAGTLGAVSDPYAALVADLAAEQASFRAMLESLRPEDWERPTHAPGWAVRDQVAHIAHFDEAATLAMVDEAAFSAGAGRAGSARGEDGQPGYITEARLLAHAELFAWWERASVALVAAAQDSDARRRLPWYGPPMSATSFVTARLMECWSHGLDVEDVVPFVRAPSDRLRHIAFLGVRTRNFSYATRGLEANVEPVRVELRLPSGELLVFGEPRAANRVTGPAFDFCQVVTQRRHYLDTALEITGEAAAEWMRFAQAFAGPPGEGRQPGQFAHP